MRYTSPLVPPPARRPSLPGRASGAGGLALLVAGLASAPAVVAQEVRDPEAKRIIEAVLDARKERLAGVDDYTVVQSMNGAETTLYYEKVMVDGFPGFRVVPPDEYEGERYEQAFGGGPPGGAGQAPPGPGAPGGTPIAGGGMGSIPDMSALSEVLPALPGGLSELADDLPDLPGGADDLLGSLPGNLPGGLPGGGGAPGQGGQGSLLERAGGAALQGVAGGLQRGLMQKGMEGLMGMGQGGADPAEDARLEARMLEVIAPRARLTGTETVDGQECWVLEVGDLEGVDLGPGSEQMPLRSMTVWIDTDEHVSRRSLVESEMEVEGETVPMTIEVLEQDYREVEGMYEPFRRVIRVSGMMEALMASDPGQAEEMRRAMQQMEEMQKQLERMPPEQRRMVEAQMGPMMERMEQMMGGTDGSGTEMVLEIRDLKVNAGPPSPHGTADLAIDGPLAVELAGMIPRIATLPDPEGGGPVWSIELMGRSEAGRLVILQLLHRGELPSSGGAPVTARVAIHDSDGTEGGFATEEGGATLTVISGAPGQLRATFELEAAGEVRSSAGSEPASITARGSVEGPVAGGIARMPAVPGAPRP